MSFLRSDYRDWDYNGPGKIYSTSIGMIKEESKMPEDRELKVMESRVKAAMEKCPQGKEILVELFPEITRGEWKEVPDDEIAFRKYDSDGWNLNSCGYHFAIQLVDINSLTQDKFKFENGRIYKKI